MIIWWLKDYDVITEENYDFVEALELFIYNPEELRIKHLQVLRDRLTGEDWDEVKRRIKRVVDREDEVI